MKKELSQINVKRLGSSPYFNEQFLNEEKISLENISPRIVYSSNETNNNTPIDIAISNTHQLFNNDQNNYEKYKNLKLIIHSNSGYDNFDPNFVESMKYPIIIGHEIRAQAVAEYILSCLFTHTTEIPFSKKWKTDRKWPRKKLSELSIYIMGYGHIGKIISQTLKPLVKEIQVYDPFLNLSEVDLTKSDVVILTSSLNPTSKHFINKHFLDQLKEDFLLINSARGEIINTNDLISKLKNHSNAYAFLDVFENEPHDIDLFSNLSNVSCSSHIAGVFKNIHQETIEFEKKIIQSFLELSPIEFNEKYKNIILKNRIQGKFLI
jgi:D-3-phosphoglycerate dehydrogenase